MEKTDGFPSKTVSFHSVVRSFVHLHDLRRLGGLAEELCLLVGENDLGVEQFPWQQCHFTRWSQSS